MAAMVAPVALYLKYETRVQASEPCQNKWQEWVVRIFKEEVQPRFNYEFKHP